MLFFVSVLFVHTKYQTTLFFLPPLTEKESYRRRRSVFRKTVKHRTFSHFCWFSPQKSGKGLLYSLYDVDDDTFCTAKFRVIARQTNKRARTERSLSKCWQLANWIKMPNERVCVPNRRTRKWLFFYKKKSGGDKKGLNFYQYRCWKRSSRRGNGAN